MAATGEEITGSRQLTNEGVERQYWVYGADDEEDVADFVATLPATIAGFPFTNFNASEHPEIPGNYELKVTWGKGSTGDSSTTPAAGTSAYRFNYQAPSLHIYQSLASIAAYYDSTLLPFGPGDFGGAINVVWDEGKQRVEGQNIQAPPEVFTINYADIDAVITSAYQATVRGLCGKVNSSTFYGAAAGEIMLVRAQGDKRNGLWNLEFGFSYIPNTTGEQYGDITGVAKKGHELLWFYYLPTKDDTAKELVRKPACVYVEQVFRTADLNGLALP